MKFAFLTAFLAWALFSTALRQSLVYDEAVYAPSGVFAWKTGDFRWNVEHPPLQKLISALPLLTQPLIDVNGFDPARMDAWRAGYKVFFQSPAPAKKLILLARLPSILLTILLGWLIYFAAKRRFGNPAAELAFLIFSLDPLVVSNGALAMNDIFVSFFIFAGTLLFHEWTERPQKIGLIAWCGFACGLAAMSKLTAGALGIVFPLIALLQRRKIFELKLPRLLASGAVFILAAIVVAWAVYGFRIDRFVETVSATLSILQIGGGDNHMGFLLAPIAGDSTWFYYPVALLIKTPLPLLILWVVALRRGLKKDCWLLIPPAVIVLFAMFTKNQFGIRYLLPCVPFMAVLAGRLAQRLTSKSERLGLCAIIGWLLAEFLWFHPHHMAYFNELVGGPRQGYKWLDGSNQDWGQDLPALASYLETHGRPAVFLGYSGSNRPEAWGIRYQDVISPAITSSFHSEVIHPVATEKEVLVVSARLRRSPMYGWIGARQPVAFPGSTLFVYDISSDVDAVLQLGALYALSGRTSLLNRQIERALRLDPKNEVALRWKAGLPRGSLQNKANSAP